MANHVKELKLAGAKDAKYMKVPNIAKFKTILTKTIDENKDGTFSKEELDKGFTELLMHA